MPDIEWRQCPRDRFRRLIYRNGVSVGYMRFYPSRGKWGYQVRTIGLDSGDDADEAEVRSLAEEAVAKLDADVQPWPPR